jgi:pimeloyl-ACP methyl ester carboxylesterase
MYAPVNGLELYYEIHGEGRPTLLLNGAYMTVDGWGPLLPRLAEGRQVIAIEPQGHGRTADADRPITYEGMADDAAALLEHLDVGEADVIGYSMGGGTALQLALRHPQLVRRLVVASATYRYDGMHAAMIEMLPQMSIEIFEGGPIEAEHKRLAPDPDAFPVLFEKLKALDSTPYAWPQEDIRAMRAPMLLVVGDSDIVRLEHAVELFGLRGGGVVGDFGDMPSSQLAVLPGTTHYMPEGFGMLDHADLLLATITPFLDG